MSGQLFLCTSLYLLAPLLKQLPSLMLMHLLRQNLTSGLSVAPSLVQARHGGLSSKALAC
eukprot:165333-Pelagomonas_calceolata.AAC.2